MPLRTVRVYDDNHYNTTNAYDGWFHCFVSDTLHGTIAIVEHKVKGTLEGVGLGRIIFKDKPEQYINF